MAEPLRFAHIVRVEGESPGKEPPQMGTWTWLESVSLYPGELRMTGNSRLLAETEATAESKSKNGEDKSGTHEGFVD